MKLKPKKLGSFKIIKLNSSRLKMNKYNISITEEEALRNGEIVKLGDNELCNVIQRVVRSPTNFQEVFRLEEEKRKLGKLPNGTENREKLREIENKISNKTFIPELVSIVFDDVRHYRNMLDRGLFINGEEYVRIMAGAGQLRKNNVFFIQKKIRVQVLDILNMGRNLDVELNPSKFSSYFGLFGSAGHKVSTPRFAVIPDYLYRRNAKLNWIDEQGNIEELEKEIELNVFDGQGLISPTQAELWAKELGLDYIPSTFIIRSGFMKGQLATFDFHSFSEKANVLTGTDIYENEFEISNVDVIISESQFKLASSFNSIDEYKYNLEKYGLGFRISRYSPKKLKSSTTTNYMTLQVLDLTDEGVGKVCKDTVEFFEDVYQKDPLKTVLAMSGTSFFNQDFGEEEFWKLDVVSKAILAYPELLNERYMNGRIKSTHDKKEKQSKLGKLFVRGNYSPLVADAYAQAEHLCGLVPKGLLGEFEHYSEFWNNLGVSKVAAARSPLTHNSELCAFDLVDTPKTRKWYKYQDTSFILPISSLDTLYMADSDEDGDIVMTTDSPPLLDYRTGGLPIAYDHGSAPKAKITDELIHESDTNSFNTKIGFITNTSSTLHSLKYNFPEDSPERKEIDRRLMIFRLLQGEAIDSGKKGGAVRSTPPHWTNYDKDISELDKNILADKRPAFTRYLYNHYDKEFREEREKYNKFCWSNFGRSFDDVLKNPKSKSERKTVENYYKYSFFIFSPSPMNKISWHMEEVFDSIEKAKSPNYKSFNYHKLLSHAGFIPDKDSLSRLKEIYKKYTSAKKAMRRVSRKVKKDIWGIIQEAMKEAYDISSNEEELGNLAVYLIIDDSKTSSFVWTVLGDFVIENILNRHGRQIDVLLQDDYGDVDFMFEKFSNKRIMV